MVQSGEQLPQGAFVNRNFRSNEFEYYIQDAWHLRPNVTLTVGLRQSFLQAPYETNGQQIAPTINMHDWFNTRAEKAAKGLTVQPDIPTLPRHKLAA